MSHLLIEKLHEEVVLLTLNRPKVHNALNEELIIELTKTLQKLDKDDTVRVICLAGSGRNFCAGGDLEWMQKSIDFSRAENIQDAKSFSALLHTLYCMRKPTIALVQGAAFGGAMGLIACCDIVIAAKAAKFSFSEVKLGLVPAMISPYIIKAIGERYARRYFLTAEILNTTIAQKIGLIHEVVAQKDLKRKSQEMIEALLKNSSHAMKVAKQLFHPVTTEAHQQLSEMLATIRVSPDAQQRVRAFLKKD